MSLDRRDFLAALAAFAAVPAASARAAQTVVDATGRTIAAPAGVSRVLAAGPPAAILLYTLAPDLMLGWPRAVRPEELPYLLPEAAGLPETGRLTGRGGTANLEVVVAFAPGLILDVGSTDATYADLATRVEAQTGVPYALLDGRLAVAADTYRALGRLVGRQARAEALAVYADDLFRTVGERVSAVPEGERPRVYYARGPEGLQTGLLGSINVEAIEVMGARNVADVAAGGLSDVSLEQVLAWDPEVIVTIDADFAERARTNSAWAGVEAVRAGRIHLAPRRPFGWIDFPPSVNRLVGLWWLGRALYPERFPEDLVPIARDFFALFYHVEPSREAMEALLDGRT